MKRFFMLMTALVLVFASCSKKQSVVPEAMWYYVDADSGLKVRNEPSLEAVKTAALPYGTPVKVVQYGEQMTVDNATGQWMKIESRIADGWVFGGYLKKAQKGSFVCLSENVKIRDVASRKGNVLKTAGLYEVLDALKIEPVGKAWVALVCEDGVGFASMSEGGFVPETVELSKPEDLLEYMPEGWNCKLMGKYLFNGKMIRYDFSADSMQVMIHMRPSKNADVEEFAEENQLEKKDGSAVFGMGSEYEIHRKNKKYVLKGWNAAVPEATCFIQNWGTDWSYDIYSFLFESKKENYFGAADAVLFSYMNVFDADETDGADEISGDLVDSYVQAKKTGVEKYVFTGELMKHVVLK